MSNSTRIIINKTICWSFTACILQGYKKRQTQVRQYQGKWSWSWGKYSFRNDLYSWSDMLGLSPWHLGSAHVNLICLFFLTCKDGHQNKICCRISNANVTFILLTLEEDIRDVISEYFLKSKKQSLPHTEIIHWIPGFRYVAVTNA